MAKLKLPPNPLAEKYGYMRYGYEKIPDGHVVVHNHVTMTDKGKPRRDLRSGIGGFRFWHQKPDDQSRTEVIPCDCGWGPKLGTHYKVNREIDQIN
jgi:hypothetical protein